MIQILILSVVTLCLVAGQQDAFEEEVPSTHMPHLLSTAVVVDATIGEAVTFPCAVDDLGVFVLLWKKGKSRVLFAGQLRVLRDDRFQVADESSLQISSVQPKDSGEYICQISTNPPLELTHTLNVLYPPTAKPNPRDGLVTVKEGESVTLSCETTGNPAPRITWKHAGRNYDITDGGDFLVSNAIKSNSGEYECIADNGVGDPASAVITVEVVSAPKVYPRPRDGLLVVKEGETISISCEATGDPAPVITWKKPGGDKAQSGRDGDRIVISEADRSHAGSYECIANNTMGIFTSAIIRVQVLFAPEIKVPNPWIHAGEGSTVNVSCIVKGEPVPSVMWKKGDGQLIHSNDHFHLKTSGHLHNLLIHHLREEDFGRYECVASNSLSSVAENIHIIGTPQVPSFTSKPHGSQGSRYTLIWMVKSHSSIDEYSLMYRKKSEGVDWTTRSIPAVQETGNIQTHTYQLADLEPGTSYEAVVTAKNKFGWSKQSETFVFITKHEILPSETPEETTVSSPVDDADSNAKHSEAISESSCCRCSTLMIVGQIVYFLIFRQIRH